MKHHPSDSIPFTRIIRALALLAFLSTLNFNHQLSASALGTGFTYQGRLASGTNAATGLFDMRFALYDALSGGTQQGSTLTTNAVPVTNGYFAVTLDFGNWFAGSALWLDIGVKTNLAGSWTPLTPRQQLTPGPYALYSPNAGTATLANSVAAGSITSAALAPGAVTGPALAPGAVSQLGTPNGTQTNAVQVDTNGWVGVGTNSPHAGLQVSGGAGILSATVYQEVPDGTGSFTNLAGAWAVAFSTNLLAVAAETDNALTLVDTTGDLLAYRFSVANGTGPYTNLSGPVSVAFWTNRLLAVAAATNAVTLIDASTSAAPVWKSVLRDGVGEFSLLGGASAVAFNDRMLAIAAVTDNSVTLVTRHQPRRSPPAGLHAEQLQHRDQPPWPGCPGLRRQPPGHRRGGQQRRRAGRRHQPRQPGSEGFDQTGARRLYLHAESSGRGLQRQSPGHRRLRVGRS